MPHGQRIGSAWRVSQNWNNAGWTALVVRIAKITTSSVGATRAICRAIAAKSARRRPFTYENIWVLRQRWGLPAVKLNPTGPNPPRWADGSYSVQGAAAAIGVTTQAIFDYLAKGLLSGRQIAKG
jgi:hypothetical protein